ncbi:MAG: hypothetical protein ACPIOQ_07550 [Promethearchaeia archaeon]
MHLFHMRLSALTGAHRSTANRRNELEESDLNTKAASVFTVLDTDKDGSIAIVELWSGLMDLGYFPNEISTILGLAAKMRKLHADNPAHYIHATNASDLGDALGSPFGLRQIRKAQVLSPEDVMAREEGKARQTVSAASSAANVGSSPAEQSLGSEKPTGSPLSGDAVRREAAGRRDEERPENDSMPRAVEFKDESRGSRCDIEVLEVKEMFPAVTKVEFAEGMGQAVMQMSPERRSRWCANVDMRGEVFHALPKEICGVDGKLSAVKRTPYSTAARWLFLNTFCAIVFWYIRRPRPRRAKRGIYASRSGEEGGRVREESGKPCKNVHPPEAAAAFSPTSQDPDSFCAHATYWSFE